MSSTLKRRKSTSSGRTKVWSQNQKLQVVSTYLTVGTQVGTALVTGVPVSTIEKWKTTDWWKEMVLKLQADDAQELDSSTKKIVAKALAAVEDRLDNGDPVYNFRSGEVHRVPVKAQTALKISTDLLKEQRTLREAPKAKEIEQTIDARLLKLAEEFSKLAKEPKPEPLILDIPMVEVVDDQA